MTIDERAEAWVSRYIEDCGPGAQCKLFALNSLIREAEYAFREIHKKWVAGEKRSRVRGSKSESA
jgi:hypothetical protein